jgi:hypothetical protein
VKKALSRAGSVFFPFLLIFCILASGTLLAMQSTSHGREPAVLQIINSTDVALESANHTLLQKHTYTALWKFGVAFLQAAIDFEFIPQFHWQSLWEVLQALPPEDELRVSGFTVEAKSLQIHCTASGPEARSRFCFALQNSRHLSRVSVTEYLNHDGDIVFTVSCTPVKGPDLPL